MTYIIKYQEKDMKWRETSYSTSSPKSREFLINFFGLNKPDVVNYEISEQ